MRRLSQHDDRPDDRGVATILVVLMVPVLFLFGALVFDGGRGLVARRQTQNAADAAALAKASDCARGVTTTNFAAYETDGAVLDAPTPTCGSGTTTVTMKKQISFVFNTGGGSRDVKRSATAKWTALNSSKGTFPITIATCAVNGLSFGQAVTFHSHNFGGCSNPSGQFGWTDINCSAPATVTVGVGFGIGGTTGNTPKSCTDAQMDSFVGKDILVPVWDPTITSCGMTYCLTTFVEFHLTGWSGNGAAHFGAPPSTLNKQCDASADGDLNYNENTPCIRGYFVKFSTQLGDSDTGVCNTSTVLFVCRVYLTS